MQYNLTRNISFCSIILVIFCFIMLLLSFIAWWSNCPNLKHYRCHTNKVTHYYHYTVTSMDGFCMVGCDMYWSIHQSLPSFIKWTDTTVVGSCLFPHTFGINMGSSVGYNQIPWQCSSCFKLLLYFMRKNVGIYVLSVTNACIQARPIPNQSVGAGGLSDAGVRLTSSQGAASLKRSDQI